MDVHGGHWTLEFGQCGSVVVGCWGGRGRCGFGCGGRVLSEVMSLDVARSALLPRQRTLCRSVVGDCVLFSVLFLRYVTVAGPACSFDDRLTADSGRKKKDSKDVLSSSTLVFKNTLTMWDGV